MLFNSYEFIFVFLPITICGFYFIGQLSLRSAACGWLVVASLIFYAWWNAVYVFLLVGSILFNYVVGRIIAGNAGRSSVRFWLYIGVGANIAVLGYFKYTDFFLENLGVLINESLPSLRLILPLGISFFTFQQIAYLVDASRGEERENNLLNYALFVSFFPQLIAGPIVHHKEMMPQFKRANIGRLNYEDFAVGFTIFGCGLFKKVVLADTIAPYATMVFDGAARGGVVTFLAAWQGALAYTAQIYFDFCGYSEMAIGLGRMFGIRLPINFFTPYASVNIIEFWRRWHITLSRFLREYLYFPLGGNRRGEFRRHVNIMIVMLLGGLWHGAGWTFVVWGGIHGILVVMNHLWRDVRHRMGFDRRIVGGKMIAQVSTLAAVTVAWVFFRADNMETAMKILRAMVGLEGVSVPAGLLEWPWLGYALSWFGVQFDEAQFFVGNGFVLGLLLILVSMVGPNMLEIMWEHKPSVMNIEPHAWNWNRWLVWRPTIPYAIVTALITGIAVLGFWKTSEFLYFQF